MYMAEFRCIIDDLNISVKILLHEDIALFGSITMFCGTRNILWKSLTFRLNVENIVSPTEHCYGSR